MSLINKLPIEMVRYIYAFDNTYRDVLKESLYFIEHAVPVCTCSGADFREDFDPIYHWQLMRCSNKCPKHNPSAYDRDNHDFNVYDFLPRIAEPNYTIGSPYYRMKMSPNSIWMSSWIRSWLLYMYSEWLILRRLHNNTFKKRRFKKQSYPRFMDMSHNQRILVA
tara:strand:- start:2300 stop:2794 length:495 start_codon:yes stop_codon:yes gene_type:complete